MSYTVLIKEEAHADALEAYLYYERKVTGLGEGFLKALKKCTMIYHFIPSITVLLQKTL
jgi:hypothetical protein